MSHTEWQCLWMVTDVDSMALSCLIIKKQKELDWFSFPSSLFSPTFSVKWMNSRKGDKNLLMTRIYSCICLSNSFLSMQRRGLILITVTKATCWKRSVRKPFKQKKKTLCMAGMLQKNFLFMLTGMVMIWKCELFICLSQGMETFFPHSTSYQYSYVSYKTWASMERTSLSSTSYRCSIQSGDSEVQVNTLNSFMQCGRACYASEQGHSNMLSWCTWSAMLFSGGTHQSNIHTNTKTSVPNPHFLASNTSTSNKNWPFTWCWIYPSSTQGHHKELIHAIHFTCYYCILYLMLWLIGL